MAANAAILTILAILGILAILAIKSFKPTKIVTIGAQGLKPFSLVYCYFFKSFSDFFHLIKKQFFWKNQCKDTKLYTTKHYW